MTKPWTANDERAEILKIVEEIEVPANHHPSFSGIYLAEYNMGRLRLAIVQAIEKRGKK